jgi:hypothetical protein
VLKLECQVGCKSSRITQPAGKLVCLLEATRVEALLKEIRAQAFLINSFSWLGL